MNETRVAALIREETNLGPVTDEEARAAFKANPRAFTPPGAPGRPPFETVREEVREALRQQKENEAGQVLVRGGLDEDLLAGMAARPHLVYEGMVNLPRLGALYAGADRVTRAIQSGRLRYYVMVTVVFALAVAGPPALRAVAARRGLRPRRFGYLWADGT